MRTSGLKVENGMTDLDNQATAAPENVKVWSEPTLEKVAINETSAGTGFGSLESTFPQLRPS